MEEGQMTKKNDMSRHVVWQKNTHTNTNGKYSSS